MSDTGLVTASFPTLKAARSARKRLAQAGFARNSIDIERRRDEFEVLISTRDENRARAERILQSQSIGDDFGAATESARSFVRDNRAASLILAAAAGFLLFGLTARR